MKEQNISFWAISTGNEPLNGMVAEQFVKFMSLGWSPRDQGRWVVHNLGPAIAESSSVSHVKIVAGDDQRYTIPWWYEKMHLAHPEVSKYVEGLAVHWYGDKYVDSKFLDVSSEKYPDKFIISTEACSGDKPWELHQPVLGYWGRCEDYALDIIENLNHHVVAWVDWNLILDENGGPNYAQNFVDSPIVGNVTEIFKQPLFYAMGHFSRFITPGSVRIFGKSSHKLIKSTAFLRPDGYVAVVLYNL
jgi:glucosylceramidase